MDDLAFVNQHNMVAYLEKSDENAKFHQIVDFLSTCSINYALTVSPTIYASYIEQFWNTATSKTVNSVKQIHAIVDGKAVVISKSSVRNDLFFDDEDGITCLTNDDIFENLALMGWQSQAPRNHGGAPAQTRSERVLKQPNEPPLLEGHTSGSGEGRMEHTFELMDTVPPTPHDSPLTGGYTLGSDEGRLKVKELMAMCIKLSKQVKSFDDDLDEEDASKQGRIENQGVSTAAPRTPPTTITVFDDEDVTIAMAHTLIKMKEEKAKAKGVAIKDLAELDIAQKEKQKQEEATNAALADEFDEIQARMDADHELAKQLAAKRAEAIRNKPPTRAQVRNKMITYLKHMGKYTHQQLKHKTLKELQKLYQKDQKWINDFQPMNSEEDGSNTKKAGKRIKRIADSTSMQKSPKKSKVIKEQEYAKSNAEAAADYKQEKEELRMWLAVVLDEDETVDPELLSVKYTIVDWESQNLGSIDMEDIHVYKIVRADGNTSYIKTFSSILIEFDKQDLMDLHRLVMKRFEDNTPEGYNLLLWEDLKVMFEPNAEDEIWSNQQDWTLISWKLYENCGVHLLMMDEAEAESTMAFELLKFIKGGLLGIMDFYNLVLLIQLDTAGDGDGSQDDVGVSTVWDGCSNSSLESDSKIISGVGNL
ncbi:hypothetical protein Tco_1215811 [Tanacetum coccineum]